MNEQQADALIDELHELSKTLKVIASNQERKYELTDVQDAQDVQDVQKKVYQSFEAALNHAFENERKALL